MKKYFLFLIILLICCSGCKEITQYMWDELVGSIKPEEETEAYDKSVQIKASIADATGDTELQTAMFATGGSSVVYCDDGSSYNLLGTFDPVEMLYTFQYFEIVYDGYDCELFVYFTGPWTEQRYFYKLLKFTDDPIEKIFINFTEIIIK